MSAFAWPADDAGEAEDGDVEEEEQPIRIPRVPIAQGEELADEDKVAYLETDVEVEPVEREVIQVPFPFFCTLTAGSRLIRKPPDAIDHAMTDHPSQRLLSVCTANTIAILFNLVTRVLVGGNHVGTRS